jgi:uncharacterized protein
MAIKMLVIDVLAPHEPDVLVYAERISELDGADGVTVHVLEVDEKTKSVEMTIEGEDLSFEAIKKIIEELGGSIHSIDLVSAGSKVVESKARDREPAV